MPIIETPTRVDEPNEPAGNRPEASGAAPDPSSSEEEARPKGRTTSRWVDYDTHELLEMISELEDERRWARLREGVWVASVALPAALRPHLDSEAMSSKFRRSSTHSMPSNNAKI